jgi:hypothetical protein
MPTNPPSAEPLIFPIGHYIGAFYPTPGGTDHYQQVRIGADVLRLSDKEFAVWGTAHGVPERVEVAPWTKSELIAAARDAGVRDPGSIIAEFLAAGTLVEVAAGTPSAVTFASEHRLVPLMLGLGNTPEEPWLYAIGFLDQPIVKTRSILYDLWEWAHLDTDIWAACHGAAGTARKAGVTDPEQNDPHALLTGLVESLHTLLGPNAAYLDRRLAT